MYSTCLFCHTSLGSNEVIEHLPIGRRLAFDGERGRLWVVCRRCGRWNLTPLEERWEAVEACERQFRGARLRATTPNIGLARLPEGLELVRIGRPPRAELASWRYSPTFGRRRYQTLALAGATVIVGPALYLGLHALGIGTVVASVGLHGLNALNAQRDVERIVVRIPSDEGAALGLSVQTLRATRILRSDASEGWALRVEYKEGPRYARRPFLGAGGRATITGERAVHALGLLLPRINAEGGTRQDVTTAVELLDHAGAPNELLVDAATRTTQLAKVGGVTVLAGMDRANRLALEMVCHETMERRALEGELAALESAWREAEEIASIADNMFLPPSVGAWLQQHRSGQ